MIEMRWMKEGDKEVLQYRHQYPQFPIVQSQLSQMSNAWSIWKTVPHESDETKVEKLARIIESLRQLIT